MGMGAPASPTPPQPTDIPHCSQCAETEIASYDIDLAWAGSDNLVPIPDWPQWLNAVIIKYKKIGQTTDLCSRGQAAETAENILQDYQSYTILRQAIWSSPADLQTKFWGTLEELEPIVEKTKQFHPPDVGQYSEVDTENKKTTGCSMVPILHNRVPDGIADNLIQYII
ncbi:hypothetical protein ElyMa_004974600 [Elysia marginata]|uniref:Uncharacterized protein n=1 Tax=Elysia marginata TaxID=1093978 RepID=A0AAV4J987_9GAST|nr:hypothetical protein ElyMa_004974600 [Elysia marginata]